jgi:hypothetical protein
MMRACSSGSAGLRVACAQLLACKGSRGPTRLVDGVDQALADDIQVVHNFGIARKAQAQELVVPSRSKGRGGRNSGASLAACCEVQSWRWRRVQSVTVCAMMLLCGRLAGWLARHSLRDDVCGWL